MARPKDALGRPLNQVTECIYVDDDGQIYFSIGDFLRTSGLPNDERFRRVIEEEIEETTPDIRILEEEN